MRGHMSAGVCVESVFIMRVACSMQTVRDKSRAGVLLVQKAGIAMTDEELRPSGIRVLRTRRGEDAAHMGFVVELGLDLVAGSARTPTALLGLVLGEMIAPLNYEALDDAVETGAVVETLFREFLEVFDVARRDVRPEFEDHFAFGGFEDSDFVGVHSFGIRFGFRFSGLRFVGGGGDQSQPQA